MTHGPLCNGTANRHIAGSKGPRPCAQRAIDGTGYCWYHQPDQPGRKFGSGYVAQRATKDEAWRHQRETA